MNRQGSRGLGCARPPFPCAFPTFPVSTEKRAVHAGPVGLPVEPGGSSLEAPRAAGRAGGEEGGPESRSQLLPCRSRAAAPFPLAKPPSSHCLPCLSRGVAAESRMMYMRGLRNEH